MAVKRFQHPGRRVQLHRALSKLGWGSRTQAWDWIRDGRVRIDGRIVTDPLVWVDLDHQTISRDDIANAEPMAPVTLMLHKPAGVITTRSDERGRRTVYGLLPPDLPWVFPAGRLDGDSEGLLILTNDSAVSTRLTDPQHAVAKVYRVTVAGCPTEETLTLLRTGIRLPDGPTRPAGVRLLAEVPGGSLVEFVLTEGRNRQIRRMCAAVGHKVQRLIRVAIGGLELGDLGPGEYRVLDEKEQERLLRACR
jgi:23S rRNA pseudouridine2605 synthase